jgi:DNA invertase Pin-like site-specific DNA recombinase
MPELPCCTRGLAVTIPAQQKVCREYARTKALNIVAEFTDIETAKRSGRTKFNELIAFLRKTTPRPAVLVEKTDRLYRSRKDYALLDELGVEIHLVKEGTIISDESRSSERFVHGVKVLVAKQYVDNLGEEASKGLREKAEQGHWPSVAPIGYQNNRETKRIEIDPQRGPLVRRVFEKYATGGVTLTELTGYAPAIGLTHPRSARPLVKSEIHRLLHNPISMGEFDWKGRRYPGTHDALISRELWERTQEAFADANRPRYIKHRFAYTGLLTCGACGCAITAERRKGRYVYYHCTGYRVPVSQATCERKS